MDTRSRKRGIKASRARLEIAMLTAGIKTQSELADRIAAYENLPCPPKNTVNRAFRQQFVSPVTLARIAHILQVSPDDLYLDEQKTIPPVAPASSRHKSQVEDSQNPVLGKPSLALYSLNPEIDMLSNDLHALMQATTNTIIINPDLLSPHSLSSDIAGKYQADGVLTLRSIQYGRDMGLQIYCYHDSFEQLIWTHSISAIEFRQRHQSIAQTCLPYIYAAIGLASADELAPFETIEAQKDYLQARVLLNNHQSEINLKRPALVNQRFASESGICSGAGRPIRNLHTGELAWQ